MLVDMVHHLPLCKTCLNNSQSTKYEHCNQNILPPHLKWTQFSSYSDDFSRVITVTGKLQMIHIF